MLCAKSTSENEKIIGQIVGVGEVCYQSGDRVSKNYKVAKFALFSWKGVLIKYEKYGTLSIKNYLLETSILLTGP